MATSVVSIGSESQYSVGDIIVGVVCSNVVLLIVEGKIIVVHSMYLTPR